jgi:hypothetical protein
VGLGVPNFSLFAAEAPWLAPAAPVKRRRALRIGIVRKNERRAEGLLICC